MSKKQREIVRVLRVKNPKKVGTGLGRMFDQMMTFVQNKRIVALEVVAETRTFPGRTERLIMHIPDVMLGLKAERVTSSIPATPDRRRGGRRR